LNGDVITLAPSGWTYGEKIIASVFVLYDKETESLWYPTGEEACTLPMEIINGTGCGLVGISGFYADVVLEGIYTPTAIAWADWISEFPDSKFVTDS
jgi:hypothetical protein